MKTSTFPLGLLSLWLGGAPCLAAVVQGEPAITERGPHHRVWSRQDVRTLPDGRAVTNISSFVELGSGIHRWDAQAGQYVDASDAIEIAADGSGAFGRNAAHQAHFSPNANTAGAITVITPDGKTFKSHALSLAWFDSATGQSELFASIKDSIGELHAPNVVIYPDAFDGGPGFRADLRYTYRLDGFSQDIVILTQPPELPPGYAPDTTRMEVWTEIIEAPAAILTQQARAGMTDDILDFGAMQTGAGRAFLLGAKRSAPVAKRWITAEGRTFLVEAVRYQSVKRELDKLPAPQGQAALKPRNANGQIAANVAADRPFPPAPRARAKNSAEKFRAAAIGSPSPSDGKAVRGDGDATKIATNAAASPPSPLNRQLAIGNRKSPGLIIDYDLVGSLTNFIFQCDTTYLVTNAVNFYGPTVFEGGTVVKFGRTNAAKLTFNSSVQWATAQYRPAIFTALDDHTVGTTIGSGTLTNTYGGGLRFAVNPTNTIQHVRLSNLGTGIDTDLTILAIRHAQFVKCGTAIRAGGYATTGLTLENILLYDIDTVIDADVGFNAAHLTVHQCDVFFSSDYTPIGIFYNSLVPDEPGFGEMSPTFNNTFQGSSSGLFQTVGAAAHYLANGSLHRNAGTTVGISSTLLADLKKRTTFRPIVLTGTLTNDLTLTAQAQRDTDTPDLGYHYDPLDFLVGDLTVTNTTLTALTGTAVGLYATNTTNALMLKQGASFTCIGSPTNLNRLVRYNTAQEQANTSLTGFGPSLATPTNGAATPTISGLVRFTEWAIPGRNDTFHLNGGFAVPGVFNLTDCQFQGGQVYSAFPQMNVTNCLFNRATILVEDGWIGNNEFDVDFHNNLFLGGVLWWTHLGTNDWTLTNNLFDKVDTTYTMDAVSADFNGYVTNAVCIRLTPAGSNDVVANTSPAYQIGSLASFYLPANSIFIDKGSYTNAALAGFYHYTTLTNQTKEATNRLDIGFHYVATGANGLPFDTDSDGLPDWFEDKNGNGVKDTGETGWLSPITDADTDGDGVNDFLEFLLGRNPLVAGTTNDFNGSLNLRRYTPLK